MILVDTSIWIDHFRNSDDELVSLLNSGSVLIHPFIVGELALGNLKQRDSILGSLCDLPRINIATNEEVLGFIGRTSLHGMGIGFIDAHLLASTLLTPSSVIWTRDKRLHAAAVRLGIGKPEHAS